MDGFQIDDDKTSFSQTSAAKMDEWLVPRYELVLARMRWVNVLMSTVHDDADDDV